MPAEGGSKGHMAPETVLRFLLPRGQRSLDSEQTLDEGGVRVTYIQCSDRR